jgi:serine/threonine protein kinase, bacterial
VATGTVIGTRGYMSSEQGQGKPRPSSDLYALGIICLQALTGKMPNQLDDDVDTGELVWKHLVQASPGLKQVMEKLTRYHFRDRYQSAAEALQAVQSLTSANYQQTIDATKWVNPDPIPTPNPIPQPPQPEPLPPNPIPPNPTPQPNPPSPKPPNHHRGYWILASVIAGLFAGLLRFVFSNPSLWSENPQASPTPSSGSCVVLTGDINVKREQGGNSGKHLVRGTSVTTIGEVDSEGYIKISSPVEGWIYKKYTSSDCNLAANPQPPIGEGELGRNPVPNSPVTTPTTVVIPGTSVPSPPTDTSTSVTPSPNNDSLTTLEPKPPFRCQKYENGVPGWSFTNSSDISEAPREYPSETGQGTVTKEIRCIPNS